LTINANPDATYTKHVIDFGGAVGGGMQLPVKK
jgi:hypothetical protein